MQDLPLSRKQFITANKLITEEKRSSPKPEITGETPIDFRGMHTGWEHSVPTDLNLFSFTTEFSRFM